MKKVVPFIENSGSNYMKEINKRVFLVKKRKKNIFSKEKWNGDYHHKTWFYAKGMEGI